MLTYNFSLNGYTGLTTAPTFDAVHGSNVCSKWHKILFILYFKQVAHSNNFYINTIKTVVCAETYSLMQNNTLSIFKKIEIVKLK
jgi:hypothetical protein